MALKKPGHLRRDGLGQERAGTAAQHLRQWVGKHAWLGKLENITVGHGVSLLQWRSGGANTPTIRRPTLACRHQLLRLAPNAGLLALRSRNSLVRQTGWRRGRDSNPRSPARGTTVFETAPFDRSGTSPHERRQRLSTTSRWDKQRIGTRLRSAASNGLRSA